MEDIASIAQVSRSHRKLAADVLWPALGRCFASSPSALEVLPAEHYEKAHLRDCYMHKLKPDLDAADVTEAYTDSDLPWCVPQQVFHECLRLRTKGISSSTLRWEFGLSEADLAAAGLKASVKSRGPPGTAKPYALADILSLARAKHGDAVGLELFVQARADAAAARGRAAEAKAAARLAAVKVSSAWNPYGCSTFQQWLNGHQECVSPAVIAGGGGAARHGV